MPLRQNSPISLCRAVFSGVPEYQIFERQADIDLLEFEKQKSVPSGRSFLHDVRAAQFRLHEKSGVELTHTRQIAGEGS